jgi:two-component system chemotaxis response regulator CheY
MNAPVQPESMGRAAIPAEQVRPLPMAAPPAPAFVAPRPRQCLIVDDSRVVRKVSRRIVEDLGYVVIEAENGQEALARCQASMPDLILLDWDMPVMTGIEFITALRAIEGQFRAKAVFCTSKNDTMDIARGIGAGADEYVIKPFDEMSLRAKLERIGAA